MRAKTPPLRPFQEKVRDLVLQGKNVILQAPTGSGKTRAALTPFIDNLKRSGSALPLKCLYATPLRVLSTQFYEDYQAIIAYIDKEKGTDFVRQYARLGTSPVAIQTGEQSNDAQLESLLTFCTIDQLLASFLGTPYGLGRRRANLNVGGVVGAYLVLDEYHLYPLLQDDKSCFGARTTVLAMLALLQGITPFVLMTATFSSGLLEQLAILLNATIVTIDEDKELALIAQGRHRFFEVAGTAMSAEAILDRHKGLEGHNGCSLVICNTVLRAQQRYWELRNLARQRGIDLVLLHSRLTAEDRTKRSDMIMRELGPAPKTWTDDKHYGWKDGIYYGKDLIVVATQVVEVGLDISVQTLHTESAPANSLIQRAGRCARFAGQEGHVIVYDLPTENGKIVTSLPYDNKLCEATLTELSKFSASQPIGFREEQQLIDAVHTEEDKRLLERFQKRRHDIQKDIFTNLHEHSASVVSKLIRDVAQVQVLIHDDPDAAIKQEPWRWQSFSLHPGSLASHMKFFEEQRDALGLEWVCKQAVAHETAQDVEGDSRQITQYDWPVISYTENTHAMERTLRETIMIALPNQLATYHPELGFVLRDERLSVPWAMYQSVLLDKKKDDKFKYKPIQQQSYQGHIRGLVSAYNHSVLQQITYIAQKLETALKLPQGSIDQAIRLAIGCHDLGKLDAQWQEWAWEWQQLLYERQRWQPYQQQATFFFAKTDFDSGNPEQRKWQHETKTKRPNHACESVALGLSLVADSLGATQPDSPCLPLWRAVNGAIARHHTPTADEYGATHLKEGALEAIKEALDIAQQGHAWSYDHTRIKTTPLGKGKLLAENGGGSRYLSVPQQGRAHELETWLYFVIVRALRLSDQRADEFSFR